MQDTYRLVVLIVPDTEEDYDKALGFGFDYDELTHEPVTYDEAQEAIKSAQSVTYF